MVIVVWETWLNSGDEAEGLDLTRQIWSDMQRVDGYSYAEVATQLGISVSAVEKHVASALAVLADVNEQP